MAQAPRIYTSLRSFARKPKAMVWLAIVLLTLSLILSVINVVVLRREHSVSTVGSMQALAAGASINQGSITLKVSDIIRSGTKRNFVAPAGKEYVILTLEVKNRSDEPIQILPTNDTYVKDPNGNVSYVTPFELTDPFRAGELPPGETIRGQLSYLVSKDSANKLFIDAVWSGGVIPIGLEKR